MTSTDECTRLPTTRRAYAGPNARNHTRRCRGVHGGRPRVLGVQCSAGGIRFVTAATE